jgi:hypothetical protein
LRPGAEILTEVHEPFALVLDQIMDAEHHEVKRTSVHAMILRTLTAASVAVGTVCCGG